MIQKKKFSDAIAANISVVGGLLPIANVNQKGLVPVRYRIYNKETITNTNYIILKGYEYITGHSILLSIDRPMYQTLAIITVSVNSSSTTYSSLNVRALGNIIESARLVTKNDGTMNVYIELKINAPLYVQTVNAICLTSSIIEVIRSESPIDGTSLEIQGELVNL